MLFPHIEKKKQMEKEASLVGLIGGAVATDAAMEGLKIFGKSRNANFLDAGIQLGRKGEKMNPFTENLSRNLLGNKQLAPYDAGIQIGNRMQEMEPEKQERFLHKVVGMGSARKQSLEEAGNKVKNPVLNALDQYQVGADRHHPLFQSIITKGSKPQEEKGNLAALGAHALSAAAAPVDVRTIARPAVRKVESFPAVQNVKEKLFPVGTKREKGYNMVRDYID